MQQDTSVRPPVRATALEQLRGRRARLERELSAARGASISTMNQRTRLLKDINSVEDEIRSLTNTRPVAGENQVAHV